MLLSPSVIKLNKSPLLMVIFTVLFYWCFAYDLTRTDYTKLIILYAGLFFLFYKLIEFLKTNFSFLEWLAFGFRAIFILAIPNLSQDFYRFIWDGRMILEGLNPYLYTVESFLTLGDLPVAQAQELRNGMGDLNASHFTNYPPINQFCFVIANLIPGQNILSAIIGLRLIIIAADFGTLYFGKKLLLKLNIPTHHIFWYILNPFIIIELTGNLHFEGVMIFFLIWSLYLLHSGKWQWAGLVLALSISVKLIPLIFLPLLWQWFIKGNVSVSKSKPPNTIQEIDKLHTSYSLIWIKLSKLIGFYIIVIMTTILLFMPFYSSEFINNYTQTIALWFKKFEFNGSLYYIAREIGYTFRGWNEIEIISAYLTKIVIGFVLILAFFRKNKTTIQLISGMLIVLSFYYFTATTVHPWYIATLLALSVFTKYNFPLVWSFVIILSYLAYLNMNGIDKYENLWIIALEYTIVYGFFIWEVFYKGVQKEKPK